MFISCCLRTCIPCRWNDTLIVCRATIFDMDPMTQTTTRCIYKANTFCILRPGVRFKLSCICNSSVTVLNVCYKLIIEVLANICSHLCIKTTTSCTTNHCCHPHMRWYTQYLRYCIDLANNHRFCPSWVFNDTLFYLCIDYNVFC